jgi:hypothetical protein
MYRKPSYTIERARSYILQFPRLDTIGIAGFSYDFRTLNGEHPDVEEAFESFSDFNPSFFDVTISLMESIFPVLGRIPTFEKSLRQKLGSSIRDVAVKLLADSKKMGDQKPEDKSIMGLLRSL